MTDRGAPVSYMVLERGTPVFSSDGEEIGTVEQVVAEPEIDIFDGLVVETREGMRFADAPNVAEIYERGVELDLDSGAAHRLPNPEDGPEVFRVDWEEADDPSIGERITRAFEGRFGELWKRPRDSGE